MWNYHLCFLTFIILLFFLHSYNYLWTHHHFGLHRWPTRSVLRQLWRRRRATACSWRSTRSAPSPSPLTRTCSPRRTAGAPWSPTGESMRLYYGFFHWYPLSQCCCWSVIIFYEMQYLFKYKDIQIKLHTSNSYLISC